MSEFASNVTERMREARSARDHARAEGDDYLVGVHTGELESLARLAQEHDLRLTVDDADEPVRAEGQPAGA
ncbi:hypothetical protein [Pseudokineococcus sp. 1T1Z-3]|uniref:hypothetical protein n=1 Tax=Pseudokineococcus sp. 1T1Z-3 TaxID=3132745 RepID=UPI0030A84D35